MADLLLITLKAAPWLLLMLACAAINSAHNTIRDMAQENDDQKQQLFDCKHALGSVLLKMANGKAQ